MNNSIFFVQLLIIAFAYAQNTPVIGGACKTGTADVQIGGKQTQFFLKCEANDDAEDGNGIWVVKSRANSPTSNEAQQHPKKLRKMQMSNVCEQDSSAREGQSCTTSETCLQQNYEQAGSYLQCDAAQQRWVKRSCQQDFVFSFEHQSCIGHSKTIRHVARQATSGGVICTYTQCNNNSPCNIGTCNNGYCCSSAPVAPIAVTQSCPTCRPAPQVISIRCPGGGMPYGTCNGGYCSAGYTCMQSSNMCCASVPQVYTCPGGRISIGTCNNGRCGSGYSCYSVANICCPASTVCADGTQAAGACVNNQCGTGFTCTNGLCCTSSSSTPRCLDGSSAVGACINGRCGSGYTCTTGNICCPSTTSVCPTGQVSIGRCVNNACPSGYTCTGTYPNNYCCGTETTTVTCLATDAIGPCINNACDTNYICDTTQNLCCPDIDTTSVIGPCIGGTCPTGYLCLNSDQQCYAVATATCAVADQAGPCVNGTDCSTGYTCSAGVCCPA
uniref:CC domain-containing protein n=1 Tax=Panagrolaimus sp. JU765 TaxID=591449 RepID=A0AC34Q8P3_9BILA